MLARRDEKPWMQSDFYRYWYHKLLRALMISTLIIMGLIAAIIYVILTEPSPPYYASTTTGQIIPLVQVK